MSYYYLIINLATISIPFIFSFHPKIRFDKKWPAFWPALIITGVAFILWDMLYTHWEVWGFNDRYLVGIDIFNLPLEEILFFICIPYACVFTYYVLDRRVFYPYRHIPTGYFSGTFALVMLFLGIISYDQIYTSVTLILMAATIAVGHNLIRDKMLSFYYSYAILLIPFFIVNGALTGMFTPEPVVWYDDTQNFGIRLVTIPVEDVFYGMALILINVILMEKFSGEE